MTTEHKQPACTEQTYHISPKDLPLSCPMPDMALWNAHPRVYLPIEDSGKEICPYCGAVYILDSDKEAKSA